MKCKILTGMTTDSMEKEINTFLETKIEVSQVNVNFENERIMRDPIVCYVVPTGNAIAIFYE